MSSVFKVLAVLALTSTAALVAVMVQGSSVSASVSVSGLQPTADKQELPQRICQLITCTAEQSTRLALVEQEVPHGQDGGRNGRLRRQANAELASAFRSEALKLGSIDEFSEGTEQALDERRTRAAKLLLAYHGLLTTEQRTRLADQLEARGLGLLGRTRSAPLTSERRVPRTASAIEPKSLATRACEAVSCTGEQSALLAIKLAAQLPASETAHPDGETPTLDAARFVLLTAFRGDAFTEQDVISYRVALDPDAAGRVDQRAAVLMALHSVLDTEQRDRVANRIEASGLRGFASGPGPLPRGPTSPTP